MTGSKDTVKKDTNNKDIGEFDYNRVFNATLKWYAEGADHVDLALALGMCAGAAINSVADMSTIEKQKLLLRLMISITTYANKGK